jgi:hypothetical protein
VLLAFLILEDFRCSLSANVPANSFLDLARRWLNQLRNLSEWLRNGRSDRKEWISISSVSYGFFCESPTTSGMAQLALVQALQKYRSPFFINVMELVGILLSTVRDSQTMTLDNASVVVSMLTCLLGA